MMDLGEIKEMKGRHESEASWQRRKKFLIVCQSQYTKDRLNTLSYCYVNVLLYGCRYSEILMDDLYEKACDVANYPWDSSVNMSKWNEIFEEKQAENNLYASFENPVKRKCKTLTDKSHRKLNELELQNELLKQLNKDKVVVKTPLKMHLTPESNQYSDNGKEKVSDTNSAKGQYKFDFKVADDFQFSFNSSESQKYICPIVKTKPHRSDFSQLKPESGISKLRKAVSSIKTNAFVVKPKCTIKYSTKTSNGSKFISQEKDRKITTPNRKLVCDTLLSVLNQKSEENKNVSVNASSKGLMNLRKHNKSLVKGNDEHKASKSETDRAKLRPKSAFNKEQLIPQNTTKTSSKVVKKMSEQQKSSLNHSCLKKKTDTTLSKQLIVSIDNGTRSVSLNSNGKSKSITNEKNCKDEKQRLTETLKSLDHGKGEDVRTSYKAAISISKDKYLDSETFKVHVNEIKKAISSGFHENPKNEDRKITQANGDMNCSQNRESTTSHKMSYLQGKEAQNSKNELQSQKHLINNNDICHDKKKPKEEPCLKEIPKPYSGGYFHGNEMQNSCAKTRYEGTYKQNEEENLQKRPENSIKCNKTSQRDTTCKRSNEDSSITDMNNNVEQQMKKTCMSEPVPKDKTSSRESVNKAKYLGKISSNYQRQSCKSPPEFVRERYSSEYSAFSPRFMDRPSRFRWSYDCEENYSYNSGYWFGRGCNNPYYDPYIEYCRRYDPERFMARTYQGYGNPYELYGRSKYIPESAKGLQFKTKDTNVKDKQTKGLESQQIKQLTPKKPYGYCLEKSIDKHPSSHHGKSAITKDHDNNLSERKDFETEKCSDVKIGQHKQQKLAYTERPKKLSGKECNERTAMLESLLDHIRKT
ncbi:uncharacterized protein LOC127739438 [Mytilus californianus]|uniref:uncharacterized protein LOC127739438 n=1 Tax=Mytilus californianus TaxID=6549 RepID=UPI0022452F37|nr:uncharacterized protein LOC127739438 [Mytilus californianus]